MFNRCLVPTNIHVVLHSEYAYLTYTWFYTVNMHNIIYKLFLTLLTFIPVSRTVAPSVYRSDLQ